MSISIYRLDESTLEFTTISVGTFEAPVTLGVRPGGSAMIKKLFLRNSDDTKWYDGLTLRPVSITGDNIVDGSVVIKLLSGDIRPSEEDWIAAPANNNASLVSPVAGGPKNTRLPELGSALASDLRFYPFWIRVETSKAAPIGDSRFSFELEYTENII